MDTFPEKIRPDDRYLFELSDIDQRVVYKHLRFSGQIQMYDQIHKYLINQIHHKKSIKKRLMIINIYLKQTIYINRIIKRLREALENSLREELSTNNFNYMAIYYKCYEKPIELWFNNYNSEEWCLDHKLDLTKHDIKILEKFKNNYLNFLKEAIGSITSETQRDEIQRLFFSL
jgi:hypothetical protein